MPLTQEEIVRLLNKKAAPASKRASTEGGGKSSRRLSRIHTQYAKLPPNNLVRYIPGEHSKPCTSYGCGAPTYYMFSGSPLCSMHIVFALVHELNLYSRNGTRQIEANGDSSLTSTPGETAAVPVSTNGSDTEQESWGENDSYL